METILFKSVPFIRARGYVSGSETGSSAEPVSRAARALVANVLFLATSARVMVTD